MLALDLADTSRIIKIDDTISDVLEGINAKCISVGIIEGSSELGLSLNEFKQLDPLYKTKL